MLLRMSPNKSNPLHTSDDKTIITDQLAELPRCIETLIETSRETAHPGIHAHVSNDLKPTHNAFIKWGYHVKDCVSAGAI